MKPPAQKVEKKISEIFDKRRLLSGHIFFYAGLVPLASFLFSISAASPSVETIGSMGSHIHLINYLWPRLTAQGVWNNSALVILILAEQLSSSSGGFPIG